MQETQFRAMGCAINAIVDAASPNLSAVEDWFAAWEQCLSRFRPSSELMQLNQRIGLPTAVSQPLWEVLQLALAAAEWCDGLVVPTILGALLAAGYDRPFAELERNPAVRTSPSIASPGGWRAIRCLAHGRQVRLPAGAQLDFGGIAKGWAADTAALRLAAQGAALVDVGGDIAVSGPQADGTGWPIGVPHPLRPAEQIALLWLAGGGVATSGRDLRSWQAGGVEQHHIIDPRSGLPAQTDVISATVIGPSAADAEVAAKAALILGSRAGIGWLDQRPLFAGMVVCADGSVVENRRWREYRWPSGAPILETVSAES
jgi:thiamine biosynthesis lipoprotein